MYTNIYIKTSVKNLVLFFRRERFLYPQLIVYGSICYPFPSSIWKAFVPIDPEGGLDLKYLWNGERCEGEGGRCGI
jgi:hypothetical protein